MTATSVPRLVGIGGPSGAGKSLLAAALQQRLGAHQTEIIPLDAYYLSHDDLDLAGRSQLNFDSPDAFEWPLLSTQLDALRSGHRIERPVYDYATHQRSSTTDSVAPARHVIVEGVLALYEPTIRDQMCVRVYVDCNDDLCLQRRIDRDCRERGRSRESVLRQFAETVQPMCERYVRPTREYADIVVNGDQEPSPAVNKILARLARAT